MTTAELSRTDEALDRLQRGVAELAQTDHWRAWLGAQAKFHRYSFNNVLLIASQRPDASQVAGFRTWLTLNRCVRKGEKGIWILAPRTHKEQLDDDPNRSATVVTGFHAVPVFDLAQTDGEQLPAPALPALLEGDGPAGVYDGLVQVADGLGFRVEDATFAEAQKNGETDFGRHMIGVRCDRDQVQRIKTLAHELGHAILHGSSAVSRELRELEAESVAYVVCEAQGIESDGYSFGYVVGWAGGGADAVAGIKASAARIQKAAAVILERLAAEATR
jgi:DNA primase